MQDCIDECQKCRALCLRTVRHCLEMGGAHADAAHIALLIECAEACRYSAEFMLLGSPRHAKVCAVCAEVCRACEASCRRLGAEGLMKECADACHRCEESCARMAAEAPHVPDSGPVR